MWDLVRPDYSWDERLETEWCLCNWLLAEYVRARGLTELSGIFWSASDYSSFTFGHVLLTQLVHGPNNQHVLRRTACPRSLNGTQHWDRDFGQLHSGGSERQEAIVVGRRNREGYEGGGENMDI